MQCHECVHYFGPFRCDAFPDRDIPLEIFSGEFDHTEPYPGDHGVRFEPIPKEMLAEFKNSDGNSDDK